MKEITSKHLTNLSDLFSPLEIHLAVAAALNGQPSRVFTDRAVKPRSGLIWIQHRFYLSGAPDQAAFNRDLAQFLSQAVFPAHMESGFTFYYADPAWEDALTCEILPHHPPLPITHEYYELDTRQWIGGPVEVPEGFTLQPVSPELTQNRNLENLDDLLEELCSERPSVEDFLAHSFGTCLLNERHIVTWVLSEYNQGERCEVGIATHPDYQRRGFAALTGRAFVEQARQAGMHRIGWHCRKNNTPSGRTALAIGFRKVQDLSTWPCMAMRSSTRETMPGQWTGSSRHLQWGMRPVGLTSKQPALAPCWANTSRLSITSTRPWTAVLPIRVTWRRSSA